MEPRCACRGPRGCKSTVPGGNRLFKVPLFTQAAQHYAAALSKWKHPAFHFNLALTQLNLGLEVEAHDNLERALQHGEAPLGEKEFQEAQKQLQDVECQLARIRVTCQTAGAEVTLDGVMLFTGLGSHQEWVKAKGHELTARRPGYLSEARHVLVSPGEVQDIELKLVTLSEATDTSRRWPVWRPRAVALSGGAVVAVGGALHALAARNFNAYDESFQILGCGADLGEFPGCTTEEVPSTLNARLQRARRQQAIAIGAYITGGSLFAAGVVLMYLNRPRLEEQQSTPAYRITVVPEASNDMLGILLSVTH